MPTSAVPGYAAASRGRIRKGVDMNGETIEVIRYTYHCFSSRERNDIALFLYDEHARVIAQVLAVPDGEPLPSRRSAGPSCTTTARPFPRS